MSDAPGIVHGRDKIVALFRDAGFVSDATPKVRRPRQSLTVYRGCHDVTPKAGPRMMAVRLGGPGSPN